MQHVKRLSKLMRLSWEIQKTGAFTLKKKQQRSNGIRSIRSLALESAWAIVLNEQITVYHLVRRYSHDGQQKKVNEDALTLFQNS